MKTLAATFTEYYQLLLLRQSLIKLPRNPQLNLIADKSRGQILPDRELTSFDGSQGLDAYLDVFGIFVRVFYWTVHRHVQGQGFGDAFDGQIPGHGVQVLFLLFKGSTFEGNGREFLRIKNIWTAQVVVSHFQFGVEAGRFDGHFKNGMG